MKLPNEIDQMWVATLLAIALLQGCGTSQESHVAADAQPVSVQVLAVHAAPIEQFYEVSGAVRARQRAVLASRLQASVLAVPVKLGDAVREGQLLAELDPSETDAEFNRAQAALEAARSAVRQAENAAAVAEAEARLAAATFARFRQLFNQDSVSQQEFDQADARNKAAQAALEMARTGTQQASAQRAAAIAALESAHIRQGYTRITAPFAGYVAEKSIDAGSIVSPGMPLLVVEDSTGYQLDVALPESRSPSVKLGDNVAISIPSLSVETSGQVQEMQPGAEAGSRTTLVRVALPAQEGIRTGLFGRARFSMGSAEALAIPAVLVSEQGELRFVYVVAEGKASKRLVTIGRIEGGNAEVLSGLSDGEQIAASALDSLYDGAPVEFQP